jgi:hypothetical protein
VIAARFRPLMSSLKSRGVSHNTTFPLASLE